MTNHPFLYIFNRIVNSFIPSDTMKKGVISLFKRTQFLQPHRSKCFTLNITGYHLHLFILPVLVFYSLTAITPTAHSAEDPLNDVLDQPEYFAGATNEPYTSVVYAGFDPELPYRRDMSWAPITVELTSNLKSMEGELIVELKDGNVTYRTPINLPLKSKKAYSFFVYVPEMLDELNFFIQEGRTRTPIQTVTIPSVESENNRFVAVLSQERGTHSHLAHNPGDREAEVIRRVLYTTPDILPRFWVGYQNIDVMIWDGGSSAPLSTERAAALEQWIQTGGVLVLAAGAHWQELNNSAFRLYVPLTMTNSRVLEAGAELISPKEAIHPVLANGMVIATGELLDDSSIKVWLNAGEDPFLVERKWGAGRIVFVASSIDQPLFTSSLQNKVFAEYITERSHPIPPRVVNDLDQNVTGFLQYMVQAELPSTWFIAGYLALYIIIVVPVNYLLFRSIKRLEWAWFTVPIWAVIFAYGAYYIGALRQESTVSVNEISVIESKPNATVAATTTYTSIYSPVRRWYTLSFENPPAFPHIPNSQSSFQRGRATSSDILDISFSDKGTVVKDYLIYHWSQRQIKTQHILPIGKGVDVDFEWEGSQIIGTLTNNTGFTLINPVLWVGSYEINLPSLEIGGKIHIDRYWKSRTEINLNDLRNQRMWGAQRGYNVPRERRDASVYIQNEIQQFYPEILLGEPGSQGMAILTARVNQPSFAFDLNGERVDPKGQALFCLIFPLRQNIEGRLVIRRNSWRFPTSTLMNLGRQGNMMMGSSDTEFINNNQESLRNIITDVPLLGGKIEEMYINMNYPMLGYPQQVSQIDPSLQLQIRNRITKKYEPLSEITDSSGKVKFPARYLNKALGGISIKIKAPSNRTIQFPNSAIDISLTMNFGGDDQSTFLGRPLVDEPIDEESDLGL